MITQPPKSTKSEWLTVALSAVGIVLGGVGFAIHTTWQLGQIKGSLDRDLVEMRSLLNDHEQRLRAVERSQRTAATEVRSVKDEG